MLKEREHQVLHQLGWLSVPSSNQKSHFTANSVQKEQKEMLLSTAQRIKTDHCNIVCLKRGEIKHEGLAYMPSPVCAHTLHGHEWLKECSHWVNLFLWRIWEEGWGRMLEIYFSHVS